MYDQVQKILRCAQNDIQVLKQAAGQGVEDQEEAAQRGVGHGILADDDAEKAQKPAEKDAVQKALAEAEDGPADLIHALQVRQAEGEVADAGDDKGAARSGSRKGDKGTRGKQKAESKPKKKKPSREERGYTEMRGPKKTKDDWKKFFE